MLKNSLSFVLTLLTSWLASWLLGWSWVGCGGRIVGFFLCFFWIRFVAMELNSKLIISSLNFWRLVSNEKKNHLVYFWQNFWSLHDSRIISQINFYLLKYPNFLKHGEKQKNKKRKKERKKEGKEKSKEGGRETREEETKKQRNIEI